MQRGGTSRDPAMGDISTLLQAWSDRDGGALETLTPIVYDELHRLASHYMKWENGLSARLRRTLSQATSPTTRPKSQ
jgi:hypothetical protein